MKAFTSPDAAQSGDLPGHRDRGGSDQEKARSMPGPLNLRPASAAECVTFDLVVRLVVRAAVPAGEPATVPAGEPAVEPVALDLGLVARLDVLARYTHCSSLESSRL